MKKFVLFACVALAFTDLSFFSIGLGKFTLFHAAIVMVLGYQLLVVSERKKINSTVPISTLCLIVLALYMGLVNVFSTFKVTSYVYSLVIILELWMLTQISRTLTTEDILKITRSIILLYFLSICVGYVLIVLGFKDAGVFSFLARIYDDGRYIRPGGFSSEPSYAAIILVFALYTLMVTNQFDYSLRNLVWYSLGLVSIFLTGSSYGYLLLTILIIYFVWVSRCLISLLRLIATRKEAPAILLVIGAPILVIALRSFGTSRYTQRLIDIFLMLTSAGPNLAKGLSEVAVQDSSAGMRFMPTVQLFDYYAGADFFSIVFGNGAAQSTVFFSGLYGQVTMLGFIPAFPFNYGIVGTLLVVAFLASIFPKRKLVLATLFILFQFNADFNTQLFIFAAFMIMLCKQSEKLLHETLVPDR